MDIMIPEVCVITHPAMSADVPDGWFRWAVMVGGRPPADIDACANSGYAETQQEALTAGDRCGATAVQALRMLGVPAAYRYLQLDINPLAPGENRVHLIRGNG